jgi:hypothetical protein
MNLKIFRDLLRGYSDADMRYAKDIYKEIHSEKAPPGKMFILTSAQMRAYKNYARR